MRELDSGRELGIEPDLPFPVASLIKVPLAAATLDRIRRGDLDGARTVDVRPGRATEEHPGRGGSGIRRGWPWTTCST